MAVEQVSVPVAPGELIDKITILMIKSERMTDPDQLENVRRELGLLTTTRDRNIEPGAELEELTNGLKSVNEALWDIEDDIRRCEAAKEYGDEFIQLARSVYINNDQRAALKRQINELMGSRIVEEKSYQAY